MRNSASRKVAVTAALGVLAIALCLPAIADTKPGDVPRNDGFSIIYQFTSQPDGAYSWAGLAPGPGGMLYGSTVGGGSSSNCLAGCGTLFSLDTSGQVTQIVSFDGNPGPAFPYGPPEWTKNGTLYGVSNEGGNKYFCQQSTAQNCGTFFELLPDGKLEVLYNFGSHGGYSDALYPSGGIIPCGHSAFCGTSQFGGIGNNGTVFQVLKSGKESVLYRFSGGSDGSYPGSSLAGDSAGNLYGVAAHGGGACNCGTVFRLAADGTYTVLYTFRGSTDGGNPIAGVIHDTKGDLYGNTALYGDGNCNNGQGCGVVFRLATNGAETVLHRFSGGSDGALPISQLAHDAKGNLYGTTWIGGGTSCGGYGCGVVFEIAADGSERVLHAFRGRKGGMYPWGRVYIDPNGKLFGTTQQGGRMDICSNGCGVIYRLNTQPQ